MEITRTSDGHLQVTGTITSIQDVVDLIAAIVSLLPDGGALTTLQNAVSDTKDAVDLIKAVTDLIPDSGALTTLLAEIEHIKDHTYWTERHLHNKERWLGAVPGWDGSNEVNSASNDSLTDFVLDAGNDTWGTPLCILGSDDTPIITGRVLFDLHRLLITQAERDEKYRFRFAWGDSYAAAVIAGDFAEIEYKALTLANDTGPAESIFSKLPVGTKVFAAVWCQGQDTGTISFTVGVHEYEEVH